MQNYYEKIVDILKDYLGPAASRFIDRQLNFHLNRTEKNIKSAEIERVVEWIKGGLTLMTEDKEMIEECSWRISNINAHNI